MGVNREVDFFDRVFVLARHRQLVNYFGRMVADDMGADGYGKDALACVATAKRLLGVVQKVRV